MAVVQGITSQAQYASSGLGKQERSFAELYRQARSAQVNDNGAVSAQEAIAREDETEIRRNRDYIAGLHDRLDTVRGEILARVITARQDEQNPDNLGRDISRLSTRLESLRNKLHEEEERLSGHLLDVTV